MHDVVKSSYFTTHYPEAGRGTTFILHDEKTDQVKWEKTVAHNENAIGFNDKYLSLDIDYGGSTQRDLQVFDLESGACVLHTKKRL